MHKSIDWPKYARAIERPNLVLGAALAATWLKTWDILSSQIAAAESNDALIAAATFIAILAMTGLFLVGLSAMVVAILGPIGRTPFAVFVLLAFFAATLCQVAAFVSAVLPLLGYWPG